MAAFDAITEQPPPSRGWDGYEEHEIGRGTDEKPTTVWRSELAETAAARPQWLLVAISQAARILLRHLAPAEDVGSLSLPPDTPTEVKGEVVLRTVGTHGGVLVALCDRTIPSRHAIAWARALLQTVQPHRVLVLDCLLLRDFRGARIDIDNDPVFSVVTDAEKATLAGQSGSTPSCPFLPSGCLVEGLAAAIMSHCQVRGVPARLLVGVQAGPRPAFSALKSLSRTAEPCLGEELSSSVWLSSLKEAKAKLGRDASQPLVSELFI